MSLRFPIFLGSWCFKVFLLGLGSSILGFQILGVYYVDNQSLFCLFFGSIDVPKTINIGFKIFLSHFGQNLFPGIWFYWVTPLDSLGSLPRSGIPSRWRFCLLCRKTRMLFFSLIVFLTQMLICTLKHAFVTM